VRELGEHRDTCRPELAFTLDGHCRH
jgi:hypothetical protein